MSENEKKKIIEVVPSGGNDVCSGCGGYTADGGKTGNLNIKHFRLHFGNSGYIVTYCNECAERIGLFLLRAWQ